MNISTKHSGNTMTLELKGRIDSLTSGEFEMQIMDLINSGETRLVADCTQLEYASSSALRVFLMALKSLRRKDGELVLFGLQPQIREVFDISGFLDLFQIYQDRDEAINNLQE